MKDEKITEEEVAWLDRLIALERLGRDRDQKIAAAGSTFAAAMAAADFTYRAELEKLNKTVACDACGQPRAAHNIPPAKPGGPETARGCAGFVHDDQGMFESSSERYSHFARKENA